MMRSLVRVLFAFLAACLAAAFVQVFFAFPPLEIATPSAGLSLLGVLSIVPKALVQSALFATPFVLVAAAVAEWQGIQDWIYYTCVGIAIAFAGFMVLHMGEGTDQTLLHDYALRAFLTTGAVAGFVYWMAGGRNAGGRPYDEEEFAAAREFKAAARNLIVQQTPPPPPPSAPKAVQKPVSPPTEPIRPVAKPANPPSTAEKAQPINKPPGETQV